MIKNSKNSVQLRSGTDTSIKNMFYNIYRNLHILEKNQLYQEKNGPGSVSLSSVPLFPIGSGRKKTCSNTE
jgi:hypothetical protein